MRKQKRSVSRAPKAASGSSGGSPSGAPLSEVERKIRIRSLLPVTLEYEPFASPVNMKRLLADLTTWILAGRIHHRQASACRALVQAWIGVDEHERFDKIEDRVKALEAVKQH